MGKNFSYIKSLVFDFKIENKKSFLKIETKYVYLACSVYYVESESQTKRMLMVQI